MARTVLTLIRENRFTLISSVTTPPVAMDSVNGNLVANDGYTEIEMTLTGGVARTVTVDIPGGVDFDLVAPDRIYTLPANGVYRAGVFPVDVYGPELLLNASGAGVAIRVFSLRG
jgi:hypothetical protein